MILQQISWNKWESSKIRKHIEDISDLYLSNINQIITTVSPKINTLNMRELLMQMLVVHKIFHQ